MQHLLEGSPLAAQIRREQDAVREGVARYRRLAEIATARGDGAALKPAERLLLAWHVKYVKAITRERRAILLGEASVGRAVYGPALLAIHPQKVAVIGAHEVISCCMKERAGTNMARLAERIGKAVNSEANLPALRKIPEAWRALLRHHRDLTPEAVQHAARKARPETVWSRRVHTHLGMALIWLLLGVASARPDGRKPALRHKLIHLHRRKAHLLSLTDEALAVIEEGHQLRQHLRPRYVPMLCRPLPWGAGCIGGYLRLRSQLVKKPCATQKAMLAEAGLAAVHAGVNALNAASWRINRDILDRVQARWEEGGSVAGVPPLDPKPLPLKPVDIDTNPEAKKAWKRQAAAIHRANAKATSVRVDFTLKLQMAQDNAACPELYEPHQLDFRGRAYPLPYLNHQQDDISRGLLTFADAKPVGERGLWWLKVHAANCAGINKLSFADRVQWVDSQLADIVRYGAAPFDLKTIDKPWQFVAACEELRRAHQHNYPETYQSSLPIQLDGSANGLQHYVALGRDADAARVVNILPADTPQDVYAEIATQAAAMARVDAEGGHPMAMLLDGRIDRKLVKTPIMTKVYGVTMVGERRQIHARLAETDLPTESLYAASIYLSRVADRAMGRVCKSASEIMDWLVALARTLAKRQQIVSWTSPIGLPIAQPYRNRKSSRITTILQDVDLAHTGDDAPPSPRRQVQAFAPNFIHAIDSSHMLHTAAACHAAGIAFAGVHDSFWTHPADVDRLNGILRERFVALHTPPLLLELWQELRRNHPGIEFPPPPDRGALDMSAVLNSPYFFS